MTSTIAPGLLVLHGNRLEDLRQVVFDWIRQHPQDPLEEAIFLVQSNGIAEWLKMALAEDTGICAATRVELPARFLWRAYRQTLGRAAVPAQSPLDKNPLLWRLLRLLPAQLAQAEFAPLRRYLADGEARRLYQLAERLADLFDQYQVYRADWLEDWAAGRNHLRRPGGDPMPLKSDDLWQASLWRAILADTPDCTTGRAQIHRRFLAYLQQGEAPQQPLPRRVVVFGISALPLQTLEALAAVSRHCQVILATPNPCQYHWADIISGRELLQQTRRRQRLKGTELRDVPLEAMHLYCNPLLASWGRMGRDYIRLLDEFDDALATQQRFELKRIDLFDEDPGHTLLGQVQARIRDLEALNPEDRPRCAEGDESIVFHIAHSALREVEILHDQLLARLAGGALRPRDIVVMVPDIETFAPAIRAVFGQYSPHDPRFIPFGISDQQGRGVNPLLCALEWLLTLPDARCSASEISDLLDVPALARRFGLSEADLPRLAQWMDGAGIRWGLSQTHRADLNLAACGEQNSWLFGLRRMLLGFANGDAGPFAGIEPYDEVGGLDAALAGSLATLVRHLQEWQTCFKTTATPAVWRERGQALLEAFFDPREEADRLTLATIQTALHQWLETCEVAGFAEPLPLAVLREAWLKAIDEPSINQRFLAGGVTFCTLMPMRAVPFRVVCLLGMNDGDYPRQASRADFDLLSQAGQYRPGDRSRRDDDRYLMLEALLAARQQLYISWVGRSARDNSPQPPSVLVAQLRDYLEAGWALDLNTLTHEHPLQPFSRAYFEGQNLFTYAREWSAAHQATSHPNSALPVWVPEGKFRLTQARLIEFLKSPVKHFFRHRLDVVFADADQAVADDETFALNKLDEYQLVQDFLGQIGHDPLEQVLTLHTEKLTRTGQLPVGEMGRRSAWQLARTIRPIALQWQNLQRDYPDTSGQELLHFTHQGLVIEDWLVGLRSQGPQRAWFKLDPGVLCDRSRNPRPLPAKMLDVWLRQLLASACGLQITGVIVSRDALLTLPPLEPETARTALQDLLTIWLAGMQEALPLAPKTAMALLQGKDVQACYEGGFNSTGEMARDPALARCYPDFAALTADGRFAGLAETLFTPMLAWLKNVEVEIHSEEAKDESAA